MNRFFARLFMNEIIQDNPRAPGIPRPVRPAFDYPLRRDRLPAAISITARIVTPAEIYLAGQSLSRIKITNAVMKQLRLARMPTTIATFPVLLRP